MRGESYFVHPKRKCIFSATLSPDSMGSVLTHAPLETVFGQKLQHRRHLAPFCVQEGINTKLAMLLDVFVVLELRAGLQRLAAAYGWIPYRLSRLYQQA